MRKILRDNGLSIVLFLFFLFSIVGQSIAGLANFNEEQREHSQPALTYIDYVTSAGFAESVFENWESEFFQMAFYVVLTAFLYQRGSAESKDPEKPEDVDEEPHTHVSDPEAPYPVRVGD
jgi:lipoprotein signal peptidase